MLNINYPLTSFDYNSFYGPITPTNPYVNPYVQFPISMPLFQFNSGLSGNDYHNMGYQWMQNATATQALSNAAQTLTALEAGVTEAKENESLNKEKHEFIMNCVRCFGKCIRDNDSYYTFQCVNILSERVCIYETYEQSLKYLLTILFPSCRFSVLFPALISTAKKFPQIQEAVKIINKDIINYSKKELILKYLEHDEQEAADTALQINYI